MTATLATIHGTISIGIGDNPEHALGTFEVPVTATLSDEGALTVRVVDLPLGALRTAIADTLLEAARALTYQEAPMPDQPTAPDEPMLRWFEYDHLPEGPLRTTSAQFAALAYTVTEALPRTPERTVALRKLLEAKDAAVRCALEGTRA